MLRSLLYNKLLYLSTFCLKLVQITTEEKKKNEENRKRKEIKGKRKNVINKWKTKEKEKQTERMMWWWSSSSLSPNDHSTSGSLSTCPLGAEVNDRLALCDGGLKKIRGQLMLEKREFFCLFLSDPPPPRSQLQVYCGYEKAALIGRRGKLSSDTSYKLTGLGWVMAFEFYFYIPISKRRGVDDTRVMCIKSHMRELKETWTLSASSLN